MTIGYATNPGIHERLSRALGVDYRGIGAPYVGLELYKAPQNRRVDPLEGCIMRWVPHETGGYWDFCDFPLQDAEDEAFDAFPVPDPDDFDYDAALERAKSYGGQYALYIGNPGMPDIINSNGRIMGMEDVLCHLLTENEAAMRFIQRRADFQFGMMERLPDKLKGYVDFMWLGEDLGTQHTPMISLSLYLGTMRPIHQRFVDLAKAYGIPTIVHTCGLSSWVYEDFIDMGVRGVDTLQPEAANMPPRYLAEHFGGRLNFRGCISTAGPLAYGTSEEVEANCRETLEIMMPHRGYHFAPTHCIQDNSPVENVLAMYQTVHCCGRY